MIHSLRIALLVGMLLSVMTTLSLAQPVVLFDEAHGQRFYAHKDGDLDLSGFAEEFSKVGYEVRSGTEPLSASTLEGIDVLVVSGPFLPLSKAEVDAVDAFVSGGGGLAVMLHIGPPLSTLLHRIEVDFSNGTLRELRQVIGENPLDFRVIDLEPHPLTKGLEGFSVYGAWALRGTAETSRILARTSSHAWVDLNRDNRLSTGDAAQHFGVLVGGTHGQGRFAVFGDDAIFQNRFLDDENRRLAGNLARWLEP